MFFRRRRATTPTFEERLEALKQAGFTVKPLGEGAVAIERGDFIVELVRREDELHPSERCGMRMGAETAYLVDGGYQKFFQTKSGRQRPALAEELKGLHDFEEDLKETLGLKSLYNESLGTVSTYYLYDRVQDRDRGVPRRAWER